MEGRPKVCNHVSRRPYTLNANALLDGNLSITVDLPRAVDLLRAVDV